MIVAVFESKEEIAYVVVIWVRLSLNPAIWETIAGTGWRLGRDAGGCNCDGADA